MVKAEATHRRGDRNVAPGRAAVAGIGSGRFGLVVRPAAQLVALGDRGPQQLVDVNADLVEDLGRLLPLRLELRHPHAQGPALGLHLGHVLLPSDHPASLPLPSPRKKPHRTGGGGGPGHKDGRTPSLRPRPTVASRAAAQVVITP